MNWDSITAAIQAKFEADWTSCPVYYKNETTPESGVWIRVTVFNAQRARETMTGNPATGHRFIGVLMVNIFAPANTGDGASRDAVDALDAMFVEKQLAITGGNPVRFESLSEQSESDDSLWYQVNWTCPFQADE